MSIELMTLVWKVPFPTSTQMVVALKLADHAKDDGTDIFPGRTSLAARSRCSESTVKTTLRLFRDAGILVVIEEGGRKGPHHTTRYQMNVNLLSAIARGEITITGGSDSLKIRPVDDVENMGAEFDPLENYPVSQPSLPGQPAAATRVASPPLTTNNHKEPSARESACELKPSHASAQPVKSIRVTDDDASWGLWLSEIEARGSEEMRTAAVKQGSIDVQSRWPGPNVPLPRLANVRVGKVAAAGGR